MRERNGALFIRFPLSIATSDLYDAKEGKKKITFTPSDNGEFRLYKENIQNGYSYRAFKIISDRISIGDKYTVSEHGGAITILFE